MKRRLLIVAVFLLAGAVVNVAVAWGLAASIHFSVSSKFRGLMSGVKFILGVQESPPVPGTHAALPHGA